jgi:hypothetical protein
MTPTAANAIRAKAMITASQSSLIPAEAEFLGELFMVTILKNR